MPHTGYGMCIFVLLRSAAAYLPGLENPLQEATADAFIGDRPLYEYTTQCTKGPCAPGNDACADTTIASSRLLSVAYHLHDTHGCIENDPNGPVFDPVHGVFHHFFQLHVAYDDGRGPIYGHLVSRDLIHWAQMPTAIWNGLDASVSPQRTTPYDTVAIYTGSAVVVPGAAPDGKGDGVVQIYPGLCDAAVWPDCKSGTLLAQAVPAAYAADPLLTNWSKPKYNPIVENTQRDPSSPWRTPNGEWRLRTYDSMVYGAASDADLLAGKWYTIGKNFDFEQAECPSLYPLPPPTPGFDVAVDAATRRSTAAATTTTTISPSSPSSSSTFPAFLPSSNTAATAAVASFTAAAALPTHVHKTSHSGDWWQVGNYEAPSARVLGSFKPAKGWEDLFTQRKMDQGHFYASKDSEFPTRSGERRRVNWGWATVPMGLQSLPREITFNAVTRTLEQAPIEELVDLRGPAAFSAHDFKIAQMDTEIVLTVPPGVAEQCELVVSIAMPTSPTTIRLAAVSADPDHPRTECSIDYSAPNATDLSYYEVPVACSSSRVYRDVLRIATSEKTLDLRLFTDHVLFEAFFQNGRVAMTVDWPFPESTQWSLHSSSPVNVLKSIIYPMSSIWVTPEQVRKAPRKYSYRDSA